MTARMTTTARMARGEGRRARTPRARAGMSLTINYYFRDTPRCVSCAYAVARSVCVFCARVFARVCGVLSALDGVRGARRGEARRRARTRDSIATARVVLTV